MGPRYNEGWNDMVNAINLYSAPADGQSLTQYVQSLQGLCDKASWSAAGADQGYFNGHIACAAVFLETGIVPQKKA